MRSPAFLGALLHVSGSIDDLQVQDAPEGQQCRPRSVAIISPDLEQGNAVIDPGILDHVKSIRSYQMRSFEVMLACVSNDQGEQQLFSSVPVEADRQRQQLSAVLRDIGATPTTALTVLSDGAEGSRFLGETETQVRPVMSWNGSPFDASSACYRNSPKLAARD